MTYHPTHPRWERKYREWYPLPVVREDHPFRRPKSRETLEGERKDRQVLRDICPTCHLSHPQVEGGCEW